MNWKIEQGDVLPVLKTLPKESVHCVVTSPPYWGLRDYKIEGQLGLEKTPEAYVATIVEVFREVKRVLRKDGTLWLNLGDSYWGGKGQSAHGGSEKQRARFEHNQSFNREYQELGEFGSTLPKDGKHEILKPKDLCGIPWRVAFALQADGWWLRSDIIWAKKNCMPESVQDRPTRSHEYLFLLTKSASYYYNADAIKEPALYSAEERKARADISHKSMPTKERNGIRPTKHQSVFKDAVKFNGKFCKQSGHSRRHAGFNNRWYARKKEGQCSWYRNKRDVWWLATEKFKDVHFAVFPEALVEPCIRAGSNEGDTIMDPFCGSGTTGAVALKLQRHFIGIELQPAYVEMAKRRLGEVMPLFVQEVNHVTE